MSWQDDASSFTVSHSFYVVKSFCACKFCVCDFTNTGPLALQAREEMVKYEVVVVEVGQEDTEEWDEDSTPDNVAEEEPEEELDRPYKQSVMFKDFDPRPPAQLSDYWKQVIEQGVERLLGEGKFPSNVTQALAFNPSDQFNHWLKCQRIQLINGQLYIYLNKDYFNFHYWYSFSC